MKIFRKVFLLGLILLIYSCSDNSNEPNQDDLFGTWEFQYQKKDGVHTFGSDLDYYWDEITFGNNGEGHIYYWEGNSHFGGSMDYLVKGNNVIIDLGEYDIPLLTFTWKVENDILTLSIE